MWSHFFWALESVTRHKLDAPLLVLGVVASDPSSESVPDPDPDADPDETPRWSSNEERGVWMGEAWAEMSREWVGARDSTVANPIREEGERGGEERRTGSRCFLDVVVFVHHPAPAQLLHLLGSLLRLLVHQRHSLDAVLDASTSAGLIEPVRSTDYRGLGSDGVEG